MKIVPVILCGGSGTRLWPVSRETYAKQHVRLMGGESAFQRTLRRVAADPAFDAPIVIAGLASRFLVAEQAAETGVAIEMAIEPEGRDTLPALILAAMLAARRGGDVVALALPSDHLVPDAAAFAETAKAAAAAAGDGALVTFGLKPTAPKTGFGYIRPGEPAAQGGRRIAGFVEKPDAARAQALIGEGCLWNAGMFCFAAEAGLAEIGRHAPEAVAIVAEALEKATMDIGALRLDPVFSDAPKISFDVAVMEKTARGVVVEADFEWSDIGDWREIWALSQKNADGVATEGDAVTQDARDSYVNAGGGRLVCALGVEGLAIVDTPDALLVTRLDRAQDVKGLVSTLRERSRVEAELPARVHRPWGWYQSMDLGDRFRVKRIQVAPGKRLSLQKHHHRAEHWVVVRGAAEVTRDNETVIVRENESIYLPVGCVHRLANPGRIPVELIEVQTGPYLEEDDIVRIEDDFLRT